MTYIKTAADLETATKALADIDPVMKTLYENNGLPDLRYREPGFTAVMFAIVSQQVSTASAAAIVERLKSQHLTDESAIRKASEEDQVTAGLSRQKRRYITALAEEHIDWDALATKSTDEVTKILTNVVGVGQWTAEIYCTFSLSHSDVFAAGDLALQIASVELYGYELAATPIKREKQVREFSARWQPYRAVAARFLWVAYAQLSPKS
jgi:DNA-3-methyladenine glycosylase II